MPVNVTYHGVILDMLSVSLQSELASFFRKSKRFVAEVCSWRSVA
jgi:hypothetical protein